MKDQVSYNSHQSSKPINRRSSLMNQQNQNSSNIDTILNIHDSREDRPGVRQDRERKFREKGTIKTPEPNTQENRKRRNPSNFTNQVIIVSKNKDNSLVPFDKKQS